MLVVVILVSSSVSSGSGCPVVLDFGSLVQVLVPVAGYRSRYRSRCWFMVPVLLHGSGVGSWVQVAVGPDKGLGIGRGGGSWVLNTVLDSYIPWP